MPYNRGQQDYLPDLALSDVRHGLWTWRVFYITLWVNKKGPRLRLEIGFKDRKLEKKCNDDKLLTRRHGERRAKLIKNRLAVLKAATALSDLGKPYQGPHRCHELTGNRNGQLSVDLDHPYRLIFVPTPQPPPQKNVGGLDWSQVTAISILEIVDTHE